MRLLGLFSFVSLLFAVQAPVGALAAEVELRNPLDAPRFRVSAAPAESGREVEALIGLARALDGKNADLNRWVNGGTALVPSPERASVSFKSSDQLAKKLREAPILTRDQETTVVVDHFENRPVPIYRTILVEKPDAGAAE